MTDLTPEAVTELADALEQGLEYCSPYHERLIREAAPQLRKLASARARIAELESQGSANDARVAAHQWCIDSLNKALGNTMPTQCWQGLIEQVVRLAALESEDLLGAAQELRAHTETTAQLSQARREVEVERAAGCRCEAEARAEIDRLQRLLNDALDERDRARREVEACACGRWHDGTEDPSAREQGSYLTIGWDNGCAGLEVMRWNGDQWGWGGTVKAWSGPIRRRQPAETEPTKGT